MKRYGPSRRRALAASAALKIFVRHPKTTFSTLSVRRGHFATAQQRGYQLATTAKLRDVRRGRIWISLDAARRKAREVIDQNPQDGLTPTVENWRQLPDGQIEFAIRYFYNAD